MAFTLATTQILDLVMDAFKTRLPFVTQAFATDLSAEQVKLNQTVNARVAGLPTVQSYDGTTGYKANAAEASALFTDVPVTINQHKHVPIKLDFLDAEATTIKTLLDEATMNAGYVLAKSVVDYCLGLCLSTNFSQSSQYATADSDLDMLANVREDLNGVGTNPLDRFGIVSTAVMSALTADSRISSRDYHGQNITDAAYGTLKNIQGFANIWEYPGLPANNEFMTGFFGTKEAIVLATRVPKDIAAIAQAAGIPMVAAFETLTDPDTGLTLLGIKWIEQGTFDIYCTVTVMYGAVAGKQAGGNGTLLDYAGHRLKTA